MQSNPAILGRRDSKVGIQVMNHADRPQAPAWNYSFVTSFFFFHGQKIWTANAWIHCKNTILLPPPPPNLLMLSGTTYFTLMLWIERWLGAGARGNGSEKKNGWSVEPYLSEIISSAMRVHFLKSGPAQWSGLLSLVPPLCFALISAVKFYDFRTEQYSLPHLLGCSKVLFIFRVRWSQNKLKNWQLECYQVSSPNLLQDFTRQEN